MRYLVLVTLFVLLSITMLNAAGVLVNRNSTSLNCMYLRDCNYQADIQNQVAIVTVTDVFYNSGISTFAPRYYYPVPDGASPTQLRWHQDGVWHVAEIAGVPQNPGGGPSNLPAYFLDYVGGYPLVFDVVPLMAPTDTLIVQLSYVQLLPYSFGNVDMNLRNKYNTLQMQSLQTQGFEITLTSDRVIQNFSMPGLTPEFSVTDHVATAAYVVHNAPATTDYNLNYSVTQDALSLTSMSGVFDNLPDELGDGVFTFIAEPDNSEQQFINKVFTFIIDRSGSMSGTKITQAKAAASYIVNNLNEGDMFNLISFSTNITPLWDSHQPYTPGNLQSAVTFINGISATGSTNISGAFGVAVPQFSVADPNTANIIIFLTDGQATTGIMDTNNLITYVNNLIDTTETTIYLFNFGIGNDVNTPLLTTLANDNSGIATFLRNEELETTITEFYNLIRYPVMLSPIFTVIPQDAITEVNPSPLPNLYRGNQLIVSGRYNTPQPINIVFSGNVYGQQVEHSYNTTLADSLAGGLEFIPKIWAKQKIESLLQQYYSYNASSTQALVIKQQIIDLSIAYGVVCIFTSFTGGEVELDDEVNTPPVGEIALMGNYPNPFNPTTTIRFNVLSDLTGTARIKIYNLKGQLVTELGLHVNHKGMYEVIWDGKDQNGLPVASGVYYYTLSLGKYVLTAKMTMMK
ncbi:MAG: hypothetical protein CVU50_00415 [Candidatus Cloacimonetes bacterium HGW-Cloacimonetes-3]|jgi:Ca-activated chloride channel family protein|nr:MAG: hypothetical protein CVU50_00415 [Candidatus Cloacimonetes bacterium HGW-Cloacimonetes-3]